MMMTERRTTCLLRLAGSAAATYTGARDCYLNIDAVRLRANDTAGASADTFRAQLAETEGKDERVLNAEARPWKERAPLALLQGPLKGEAMRSAFQLDPSAVPELRVTRDARDGGDLLVGLHQSPWGPAWDKLPAPGGAQSVTVKVVDPKAKDTDTTRRVYKTLAAALAELQAGDVIRIRHTGPLAVGQVPPLTSALNVTIEAEDNSHPILVLDEERSEQQQAAMFRVHKGQLTFNKLEFRLQPKRAGFESQAVALLFGDGGVQFTRCVVTLDGRQVPDVALSAVALADTRDAMAMPGTAGAPKVAFDTCFVRGDGDLVAARASRPFEMDVKTSLAALTGSLLSVDAGDSDAPAPDGQKIVVQLSQATAFLGDHLVRVRAGSMRHLVPIRFDPPAQSCLLVSAGEGKALLYIKGGSRDDKAVAERLGWKGTGNNYANFAGQLDQKPGEDDPPVSLMPQKQWKEDDGESKFDAVKFAGPLWTDAEGSVSAAEVSPRAFEVTKGPTSFGVPRPQDLPAPVGDRRD
jgi:hypothetical protein